MEEERDDSCDVIEAFYDDVVAAIMDREQNSQLSTEDREAICELKSSTSISPQVNNQLEVDDSSAKLSDTQKIENMLSNANDDSLTEDKLGRSAGFTLACEFQYEFIKRSIQILKLTKKDFHEENDLVCEFTGC